MKNNRFEFIVKIVFFGSIWGIIEATLGYALHLLPALIAGSLIFPLVMFILYRSYKSLGSRQAVLYVGLIAIMIKATNLFLPLLPAAKTINPMIAMFFQSLFVFAVIPMFESKKISNQVSAVAIVSIGWRLAMVGYYGFNYLTTGFIDFRIATFAPALSFIVFEGIISAGLAILILLVTNQIKAFDRIDRIKINPYFSTALLVIAVFLTLVKF